MNRERLIEAIRREAMVRLTEYNPYHDARGKFTTAGGASGGVTVPWKKGGSGGGAKGLARALKHGSKGEAPKKDGPGRGTVAYSGRATGIRAKQNMGKAEAARAASVKARGGVTRPGGGRATGIQAMAGAARRSGDRAAIKTAIGALRARAALRAAEKGGNKRAIGQLRRSAGVRQTQLGILAGDRRSR